jgi:phage portal protein BeeE
LSDNDAQIAYPYVMPWYQPARFVDYTFQTLAREGLKSDPIVFAGVGAWNLAFGEAEVDLVDPKGIVIPEHPLTALLERPNDTMDWAEFCRITVTYRLLTGNCYVHKERDKYGVIRQLIPYHDGLITPVPDSTHWISYFQYRNAAGDEAKIERTDIIHLKWYMPDPEQPWKGAGPLLAIARDIDTSIALKRMLLALLKNDAIPRVAITQAYPPPSMVSGGSSNLRGDQASPGEGDLKSQSGLAKFKEAFGGDNIGGPIKLRPGMGIQRIGLDLKELDITSVSNTPEAHICAVLGTPIELIGAVLGIQSSTYSNKEQAQKYWTEQKVCPMWAADDRAFTHGLRYEYDGVPVKIVRNLKGVVALRENNSKLEDSALKAFTSGGISREEYRARIGMGDIDPNHTFVDVSSKNNKLIEGLKGALNPQPANASS